MIVLREKQLYDKYTYFPNFSPSAMDSGNCLLRVSGNNSEEIPPKNAVIPNMIKGKGCQYSPSKFMYGAKIEPIRAAVDAAPKATFRITVGNCSTENTYTVP